LRYEKLLMRVCINWKWKASSLNSVSWSLQEVSRIK